MAVAGGTSGFELAFKGHAPHGDAVGRLVAEPRVEARHRRGHLTAGERAGPQRDGGTRSSATAFRPAGSSGRLRFRPVKVGGARADPGAEQPGIPSAGQ